MYFSALHTQGCILVCTEDWYTKGNITKKHIYQICSLIFFPCNSTVLILKSIPAKQNKHQYKQHLPKKMYMEKKKTLWRGNGKWVTTAPIRATITLSPPDSAVSCPDVKSISRQLCHQQQTNNGHTDTRTHTQCVYMHNFITVKPVFKQSWLEIRVWTMLR